MSINEVKFALAVLESHAKDEGSKNAVKLIAEFLEENQGQELDAFIEASEKAFEDISDKVRDLILEASDEDLYSLRGLVETFRDQGEELLQLVDDREEELLDVSPEDEEYLEEDEEDEEVVSRWGDPDDDDGYSLIGDEDDDDY